MTMLIRRDPFTAPTLARLLDAAFSDPFFSGNAPGAGNGVDEGTLAVDVSEDERNVIVRASLPGFAKENVEAEVNDGVLTIKASHNEDNEAKDERFYRRERVVTSLSRRIALPATVTEGETRGELKDGVLTLRLPKSVKPTPRKVSIN